MSTIKSSAENLTLNADGSGNDIIFQSNGSNVATLDQAGTLTATTFTGASTDATKLPLAGGTMTGNIDHADSVRARFGTGNDLQIWHDGNNSYFSDSGTGDLHIEAADNLWLSNISGEKYIRGIADGAVDIYHNNVVKLSTTANGVSIPTGNQYTIASGGSSGNLNITNTGGVANIDLGGGSGGQNFKLSCTSNTASYLTFHTNTGEQVRITDTGVGIGGTAGDKLDVFGGVAMFRRSDVNSSSAERILAFKDGGNTERGSIKISNSAVTYTTGSDYRLKENVDYTWDATTRLKQLKPARFNFIVDDTNTLVDGFIAHEVSSIVPEAISGAKDAIQVWESHETLPEGVSVGDNKLDDDGNTIPQMQGIDQSRLVPLLVKTIQEMEARITALEG
jgi:hypothetical protein